MPNFAAAVLAGGHSRRMGTDKAHLPHPRNGQTLLLYQLDLLATLNPTQLLVSARTGQELPPLPPHVIRVDDDGTRGPLAGIVSAMTASSCPHLLIIPVDLPQLTSEVLHSLLSQTTLSKGIYAVSPRSPEPLVVVLPRGLLSDLKVALEQNELSPRRLWAHSLASKMTPLPFEDAFLFQNWNRPQ